MACFTFWKDDLI